MFSPPSLVGLGALEIADTANVLVIRLRVGVRVVGKRVVALHTLGGYGGGRSKGLHSGTNGGGSVVHRLGFGRLVLGLVVERFQECLVDVVDIELSTKCCHLNGTDPLRELDAKLCDCFLEELLDQFVFEGGRNKTLENVEGWINLLGEGRALWMD